MALGQQGREKEEEQALRKAIELEPNDPFAWTSLDEVFRKEGRLNEAEEAIRRAKELESDDGGG